MKFWSSLSAFIGVVAVILGLIGAGLYVAAMGNDPTTQPANIIAYVFIQNFGLIAFTGLVLCALGGIEAAIRDLITELRKPRD